MEDELEVIKAHLRVTWTSQDDEIQGYIDEGKAYINGICGPSDYRSAGLPTILLKAYCRYVWSGSLSMFDANYQKQLLRLQIENGKKRFLKGGAHETG